MAAENETGIERPLVQAHSLSKTYIQRTPLSRQKFLLTALDDVDLSVAAASTFAVVGESGSGKSTLARCLAILERPTSGDICYDGRRISALNEDGLAPFRRKIQLIFQDTATALNPRFSAEEIITEPLRIQGIGSKTERHHRAGELMDATGLPALWLQRRQHQFSGGQRQRLAIARALALRPRFLILDEALAGLDLSIQAQIVNLLRDLQKAYGLTYLFISHDLSVVRAIAETVAVMHRGRIVECGKTKDLFANPQHPQTVALLEAIPRMPATPRTA